MAKRIAFATTKGGLDDVIADRFGRAPTFTIIEIDENTKSITNIRIVENPGTSVERGAAIKVVQLLIDERVDI
ncbi:MAG TPA: dinitrogenase iron-molybdenum cofactor biosynthesis protein, partial [Ignisphaera sp.]|nr:dinitrogenase iron-molybdenum cofactor biosynthesis protein [Ignisphaera sp.]